MRMTPACAARATLCCADTPRAAALLPSACVLQRTFREIMFLQDLNNHDNIIR